MTKTVFFSWVPRHVGVRGNTFADLAAKHVLENPVQKRLAVPDTDLKVLANMYTKSVTVPGTDF